MDIAHLPFISILVAARNEEANIASCIEALLNQNYPAEKTEIWVGNDQSEDGTSNIIKNFVESNQRVHLLEIEKPIMHLSGKANVLAQLAHQVKGEYLLITDADSTVEPTWVKTMLSYFEPGVGVITGVTVVKGRSLFAALQNAEWLFYTAHGHYNALRGKPVTAMGNNMAVSSAAYREIGGYENIPFSVTEDYELFRNILKNGFSFKSVFEHDALGYTEPHPTFKLLLHQRKRWFTGAFQLPIGFVLGLIALWAFLPVLLIMSYFTGWLSPLLIFCIKWITDIIFLAFNYRKLKLKVDMAVWLYTPFFSVCNTIFLFYQFMPDPVQWKGRKYLKTYHKGIET